MMSTDNISRNFENILHRIRSAEHMYSRPSQAVSLLAMSKGHDCAAITQLAQCGQRDFGENYLQEALPKIATLSHLSLYWHFVGSLQSNKLRHVAKHFHWVHTVTRWSDAETLSRYRDPSQSPLNICIQVKFDHHFTSSGILPEAILTLVERVVTLPRLHIRGLMMLPPYLENTNEQRHYFSQLRMQFNALQEKYPFLDTISMGMTHDFETAIAEGASLVRIGTGLFGPRKT